MKKIFAILMIVLFLAACNNSSEESTTISTDSLSADSPLTDAVNTADSASKILNDSTGKITESLIKK